MFRILEPILEQSLKWPKMVKSRYTRGLAFQQGDANGVLQDFRAPPPKSGISRAEGARLTKNRYSFQKLLENFSIYYLNLT